MNRQGLTEKYQQLHLAEPERRTAEWFVYGHAWGLLEGCGTIDWVREELIKGRKACIQFAESGGDDGAYRVYMETKRKLYDKAIKEVVIVKYRDLRNEAIKKRDMYYKLYQSICLVLEKEQKLEGAIQCFRDLALSYAAQQRDKKHRGMRKAAIIFASAVIDLGGTIN